MSNNTSPQELLADWEAATESNSRVTIGRCDAIYHVGKIMTGEWTPANVASFQATLADTDDFNYDPMYHYGYLTAWNTVTGLVKGQPLKMIAKLYG